MWNNIKEGFIVTAHTWENDGDNRQSRSIQGLSKEGVKLVLAFGKLFDPWIDNTIGNALNEEYMYVEEGTTKFYEDNKAAWVKELSEYSCHELMVDLGLLGSEYYASRVCESMIVRYCPKHVSLVDVTEEFK